MRFLENIFDHCVWCKQAFAFTRYLLKPSPLGDERFASDAGSQIEGLSLLSYKVMILAFLDFGKLKMLLCM